MDELKKKLNYNLNSLCKHKYFLVKIYKSKPKFEINFRLSGKYNRKYYGCSICGHHISDHEYNLSLLYSGNYIESTYGNYEDLKKKFNKIKKLRPTQSDNYHRCLRIKSFFEKINKPFKTLDIGSGLGIFPSRLQSKKFKDISLIETDKININFLKNYLNFKETYNSQKDLKKKKFDLITLNKVLEHIENPAQFLKDYLKNLKINGYLYIEVPNIDAKEDHSRYNREEFFIEHHHVFSKTSLILMLLKLELDILKIEKIREPSSKYTLYCFARKIKNI